MTAQLGLRDAAISCRLHIKTEPSKIIYLNGILDSYEGIGLMRTADENAGKIIIYTTRNHEMLVRQMLDALREEGLALKITACDYEDIVG